MFNGNNLPRELLLATRQTTRLRNAIESNMSTDVKLCKAQISKIIQSGRFLGSLLSKLVGPLMKVAVPLTKTILAPLGITAAASAIDGPIQKKIQRSGTTTLIISNEKMNDIMKIVHVLEDSNILLKGVNKTIKNKGTKGRVFKYVIRHFRSILIRKFINRKRIFKSWRRSCKSRLWLFKKKKTTLIPPYPLINFEKRVL